MTLPAAISATFVKVIPVAGRKQVQIVLEAPIEQANTVLAALGGYPDPANPVWVGVARIDSNAVATSLITGDMHVPTNEPQSPVNGSIENMNKMVQQAAIISDKPDWNNYVKQAFPDMTERGAEAMRKILGVQSRRELATDVQAAGRFQKLVGNFNDYQKYGVV
jgi:hypothetical protein